MNILINNQAVELIDGTDLEQALTIFGALLPYAILLNDSFLPKSEHNTTQLTDGDKVEVISAIQGG